MKCDIFLKKIRLEELKKIADFFGNKNLDWNNGFKSLELLIMFLKLNTYLEMSSLLDLSMESLWVGSSWFSFLPSLEKWNIYLHTTQVRCNSIPFLSCSTYQPCATIKKNYERKRTKYFLKEICSGHRIAGGDSLCFLLFYTYTPEKFKWIIATSICMFQ